MATDITNSLGTISRAGLADTLSPIDAAGNTFTNTGVEWVEIFNGGGTSTTVAAAYAQTPDGQTIPPKSITIAAGARKKFGPFPVTYFGSTVALSYSGNTTSVTIELVKLGS